MDNVNQTSNVINANDVTLKDVILRIKYLIRHVISKWKTILLIGFAGAVIGLILSLRSTPLYKAELNFALQEEQASPLGGALSLASQFGVDLNGGGSGEFSGDNFLKLVTSRAIIERTLLTPVKVGNKTITLADFFIDVYEIDESWKKDPQLAKIRFTSYKGRETFTRQQDSILKSLYNGIMPNIDVRKAEKNLTIISLTVKSKNELFSKIFATTLVSVLSDFYVQTKTEKSAKNVRILQKQTDSVRQELNNALAGVAKFTDATPNPNPAYQTLKVPSQRRQVDVQANTAILTELVKNLEIAKMSLLQQTPLIHIIDSPTLPLNKEKLGKIKGVLIGGFLFTVLAVVGVLIRKLYQETME